MQIGQSPFTPTETEKARIGLFEEYFWYSSEICTNCYQRVREVGERHTIQLEEPKEKVLAEGGGFPQSLEIADHFERTEYGSQEHTPWHLPSDRFGSCFCLDCATDCRPTEDDLSLAGLLERMDKVASHTTEHTPLEIDTEEFEYQIRELKGEEDNQGWDTEILALSFARAVERPDG